ncbi:MAG: HD-GYP domain-containing protein [Caldisericia bacterium]
MSNFKDIEKEIKILKDFLNLDYISLYFNGNRVTIGNNEENLNNLKIDFNKESFIEVSRKEKLSDEELKILNYFTFRLEKNTSSYDDLNNNEVFKGLNGVKDEINSTNKKLKDEIVRILLKTIETKDIETYEHSKGVTYYAKKIAEKYNFKSEQIKDIEYASLLHDIGKIALKEQVLYKPTKLREDEFEYIKKHSEIGYKILVVSEPLRNISNFVLLHHEWYNGMGYPYGLKGDSIPLEAQIISISDFIDTYLEGRNYFERKEMEDLIIELKRLKNIKFKDELVDKAIDVLLEKDRDV